MFNVTMRNVTEVEETENSGHKDPECNSAVQNYNCYCKDSDLIVSNRQDYKYCDIDSSISTKVLGYYLFLLKHADDNWLS